MEKVMTKKAKTDTTYKFEYGLAGFEYLNEFEFVDLDDFPPFKIFQSTENGDISMIVIDGQLLNVYQFSFFPRLELENLEIKNETYLRTFVILRIDEKTKTFVANTKAPLVLNTYTGVGKQVILDNSNLSEEHKLEKF